MEHKTTYNQKIYNLLMNMPKNLTDMEKARYLYLELGKMSNFDMDFWYGSNKEKKKIYIELSNYSETVICKTIAKAYSDLLNGIGIKANVVRFDDNKDIPHVETEFFIDGKKYSTNIQGDLKNIHARKKTQWFCYDECEGEIVISEDELKEIDKKLGYITAIGTYSNVYIDLLKPKIKKADSLMKKVKLIKNLSDTLTEGINGLEKIQYYIAMAKEVLNVLEYTKIDFETKKDTNGNYITHIIVTDTIKVDGKQKKHIERILIDKSSNLVSKPIDTGEKI